MPNGADRENISFILRFNLFNFQASEMITLEEKIEPNYYKIGKNKFEFYVFLELKLAILHETMFV